MADNLKQKGNTPNYEHEKCPVHNVVVQFIPPTEVDKGRRKLIVTFKCPQGHNYKKEFDLI